MMEVRRPSAILKVIYVSLVLLGSVLFDYGLQGQTMPQPAATQPPAAEQSPDAASASPEAAQTPPMTSTQPQANTQNQTSPSGKPGNRDLDSVSSNRPRFHLNSVVVGGGFTRFGRRSFGGPFVGFGFGYYPYRYYSPYYGPFYGPYYGPYYPSAGYYGRGYGRGEIKLSIDPGYAKVYVDGAFAGRAEDLKHIYLKPGTYNLSVSAQGRETYNEKIYVLSGKTLKIKTKLDAATTPASAEEKR